jgi:cell division protein FtsI (penicillin-binding protein 3)
VAGKTGTVHMVGARGYEDRYHSIFAGLAPASKPRIVTVVVVDDASLGRYHGGDVAAPVFGKVVGGAMRLLNIAPDALPQPAAKDAVAKGSATPEAPPPAAPRSVAPSPVTRGPA